MLLPQNVVGKDLCSQLNVISNNHAFSVSIPNIFVDYPLGPKRTTNTKWTNWNKAPLRLWQTQLNFAVCMWCAWSAFRISSEHLNYKRHPMVKLLYWFHVYYHIRHVPKRLQVLLPYKKEFNPTDNPYSRDRLFKLCDDYEAPYDPMSYQNKKLFGTHQHLVGQII